MSGGERKSLVFWSSGSLRLPHTPRILQDFLWLCVQPLSGSLMLLALINCFCKNGSWEKIFIYSLQLYFSSLAWVVWSSQMVYPASEWSDEIDLEVAMAVCRNKTGILLLKCRFGLVFCQSVSKIHALLAVAGKLVRIDWLWSWAAFSYLVHFNCFWLQHLLILTSTSVLAGVDVVQTSGWHQRQESRSRSLCHLY